MVKHLDLFCHSVSYLIPQCDEALYSVAKNANRPVHNSATETPVDCVLVIINDDTAVQ
jgi:hypothetical protein